MQSDFGLNERDVCGVRVLGKNSATSSSSPGEVGEFTPRLFSATFYFYIHKIYIIQIFFLRSS